MFSLQRNYFTVHDIHDFLSNLEGGEEEVNEELGETQAAAVLCGLIRYKDKDHLMDPQQWDQG